MKMKQARSHWLQSMREGLAQWFWRIAASGVLPARWFLPGLPRPEERSAKRGELHIEIVSHCWQYSHLLVYQLSSLVLAPPQRTRVTMTVYYAEEDKATAALLAFMRTHAVDRVTWNWCALPRQQLFRRGIGRNQAALASHADWIWFTDCDVVFAQGCLDTLAERLQGRRDALVYPRVEQVTTLLERDDPLLASESTGWSLRPVDTSQFTERAISRATGPLQITHGDVARAVGYCRDLAVYQGAAEHFAKCHEDRAFRWLLRTQGTPIDLAGVCRIRHAEKGRYRQGAEARVRGGIRQWRERVAGRG